jgi:hypothetical protein
MRPLDRGIVAFHLVELTAEDADQVRQFYQCTGTYCSAAPNDMAKSDGQITWPNRHASQHLEQLGHIKRSKPSGTLGQRLLVLG